MKRIGLLFLLSFCAFFFACSSPERDAKKIANEVCKCKEKYQDDYLSDGFKKCMENAQKLYDEAEKKYSDNEKKMSEFNHACENELSKCKYK